MDIINLIFNHIQNKDYVIESNIIVDKELKDMISKFKNSNVEINYEHIDELVHDAASIGQYEGFKVGMKTMLDIVRKLG